MRGNTSTGSHEGFSVSGERQTLEGNSATGAREHGIGSNEPASKSVFRDNVVTGTPGPAFFLAGFGNTITGNAADHNEIGFQDESVPGANSYTDNTCIGWTERSSQPEGLCDDTIPVEPEPATQASDSADAEGEPTAEE